MKVGVPTEIKTDEYRVALTPSGVRELVEHGHEVVIQAGAGEGSAISDDEHLAPDPELTRGLVESGATCVAYETVEDTRGRLPLLAPMSEVAGKIATQAGAFMLEKPLGGRGLLLGGVPGVAAGKGMVIGGGGGGENAGEIGIGVGGGTDVFYPKN